ncbi:MAG: type III pantothenate kinase [Acidimicrobiia bacterium]|nr:type III pantothenate kinase [Acidimicrobiia bacterium]
MLLAIDVGNTHTVIGLYEQPSKAEGASAGLVEHWRIATVADRTEDELAVMLQGFLDFADWDWDDVSGVAISSGVPRVTTSLRAMSERYFSLAPLVLGPGVKTGMPVLYDNPKEVGADRIANAMGAYDLYGGPTIVIDFGTGTTLDAISAAGEYLGGAISPGVEISLDALFDRAAALRAIELVEPRSVIGKSTMESLQSGALYGYAGQVDALARRFQAEMGDCSVVGTGGLAPLIAPHSEEIQHVEPWLTLHGLRIVYEQNR